MDLMQKLSLYIFLVFIWCNAGWTDEKNYDLTDKQIKTIIEGLEGDKKTEGFLQCVEILRGSNLKKKIFKTSN